MIISKIIGQKILASMGDETVEATITFADGSISTASVPAGLSAGKYEVKKVPPDEAIKQIGEMENLYKGKDWTQETLDFEISSHDFGGNATLAVSAAFYEASHQNLVTSHFPKMMLLLFEGGEHGNKNITMQEFCILEESVNDGAQDFAKLTHYLKSQKIETTVGAEGAFSPEGFDNNKCLEVIRALFPGKQICVDMADCFGNSPIPQGVFSVEDPFDDESWDKWTKLTQEIGPSTLVVGDDLTTTNPQRIQKAIDLKAITGVVIKPNQIGTISAAKQAVKVARTGNLKIVVSHRGQETNDTWIVDFALDVGADFVKFGGMDRGERIAKYNRLIELHQS